MACCKLIPHSLKVASHKYGMLNIWRTAKNGILRWLQVRQSWVESNLSPVWKALPHCTAHREWKRLQKTRCLRWFISTGEVDPCAWIKCCNKRKRKVCDRFNSFKDNLIFLFLLFLESVELIPHLFCFSRSNSLLYSNNLFTLHSPPLCVCACVRGAREFECLTSSSHVNTPSRPTSCYVALNCDMSEGPKWQ